MGRNGSPDGPANGGDKKFIKQEGLCCSRCTRRFPDEDTLSSHCLLKHTDEGPLECVLCDKTFLRGCDYRKHARIHTTKLRYVCSECERCFPSKILYVKHVKKSHMEGSPHYCAACNRRFSSSGCLKSHLRTHSDEKRFACTFCDKKFFTQSSLKAHRVIHSTGAEECSICKEIFLDKESLRIHFREHIKEKPLGCTECSRRFSQQKHLIIHLRTHSGVTFKCKECNRRFPTEEGLKIHEKQHLEDEPVICPRCNYKFSSFNRLILHSCKSSRSRLVCHVCSQQFNSRSGLEAHIPIHHSEAREPAKPYACTLCYTRFMTKSRLDSHRVAQHDADVGGDIPNLKDFNGGSPDIDKKEPKTAAREGIRRIETTSEEEGSKITTDKV